MMTLHVLAQPLGCSTETTERQGTDSNGNQVTVTDSVWKQCSAPGCPTGTRPIIGGTSD